LVRLRKERVAHIRTGEKAAYTRTITRKDIATYARLSGDTNPLHLNEEYAKTTRFRKTIAHGMLTASLISAALGTRLPGPGAIYLEQTIRFLKPVYAGDTIRTVIEIVSYEENTGKIFAKTNCFRQNGDQVIEGKALLLLDKLR
jgi:3-hydroxybutyryl-CoA dehydratase